MRILIVSQYFWPENFRVNDLAEDLEQRGHDITVLTGKPNYPEGVLFPAFRENPSAFDRLGSVRIFRVPIAPRGNSVVGLMLNYMSFALSASLLGSWALRGQTFDAIFVFQTSPITAALPAILQRRLKRAPVLMWILDLWPDTLAGIGVVTSPRLLALVGCLVRFIYRRCDRILIQSRVFEDKVAVWGGQRDRIRYFPGWAEAIFSVQGEAVSAPTPELAPYADDFKLLFAGNIGEAQDFPAILDAAETLRDIPALRWIVLGDGRAAAQLREEIERRGLAQQVILLGRFPLDRMPAFFAAADALLVTLRKQPIFAMTIPGKVQSYLAAGKPLLAMLDGEGARVIEEAGAGLVAPAGDGPALAARVRELMAMDAPQRSAMGQRAVAYGCQEFDRQRLVDSLELWIDEVASATKAAPASTKLTL